MEHVDGNVLAGPMTGRWAFEPTAAQGQCGVCSDIAALAQAMVYGLPMGYVARCRNCDNVLMVIVEQAGQKSLYMRGLRRLRVPDPTQRYADITASPLPGGSSSATGRAGQ